jgi:transcriptional regulator with XRE-family HTH domain
LATGGRDFLLDVGEGLPFSPMRMAGAEDQSVGRRLVEIRERLNLSRDLMADRAGITRGRLGYYERGEVSLKTETGIVLCERLDINPFFVAGRERFWKRFPLAIKGLLPPEISRFASAMDWVFDELPFDKWFDFQVNRLVAIEEHAKDSLRGCSHIMYLVKEVVELKDAERQRRGPDLQALSDTVQAYLTKRHPTAFHLIEDYDDWQNEIWNFVHALKNRLTPSEPSKVLPKSEDQDPVAGQLKNFREKIQRRRKPSLFDPPFSGSFLSSIEELLGKDFQKVEVLDRLLLIGTEEINTARGQLALSLFFQAQRYCEELAGALERARSSQAVQSTCRGHKESLSEGPMLQSPGQR